MGRGVSVVNWDGDKLTPHTTLTCVGKCHSVGVMSPRTLCACDLTRKSVSVVRVTDDTVTDILRKPEEVTSATPSAVAVIGDRVIVRYLDPVALCQTLVVYENGVSSPGTVVDTPAGLQNVTTLSSDGVSRFLVCDGSKSLFILDLNGKLCSNLSIGTDSWVQDCTVGDGKFLVGCWNGDIVIMSP